MSVIEDYIAQQGRLRNWDNYVSQLARTLRRHRTSYVVHDVNVVSGRRKVVATCTAWWGSSSWRGPHASRFLSHLMHTCVLCFMVQLSFLWWYYSVGQQKSTSSLAPDPDFFRENGHRNCDQGAWKHPKTHFLRLSHAFYLWTIFFFNFFYITPYQISKLVVTFITQIITCCHSVRFKLRQQCRNGTCG